MSGLIYILIACFSSNTIGIIDQSSLGVSYLCHFHCMIIYPLPRSVVYLISGKSCVNPETHILNCIVLHLCLFPEYSQIKSYILIVLLLCDCESDVSLWYTFTKPGEPKNLQQLFRSSLKQGKTKGQNGVPGQEVGGRGPEKSKRGKSGELCPYCSKQKSSYFIKY